MDGGAQAENISARAGLPARSSIAGCSDVRELTDEEIVDVARKASRSTRPAPARAGAGADLVARFIGAMDTVIVAHL